MRNPKDGPTVRNLTIHTDYKGVTAVDAIVPPGQRDRAFDLLRIALPAVELLDKALKAAAENES